MSHTTKYKVQITDAECAIAALKRMGWTDANIEYHEASAHLTDYRGKNMAQSAHVIIRHNNLNGAVNDFGIEIGEEDSTLYIDGGQINREKLIQNYGVEKALKEANARGYFTAEEVHADGRIRLRLRR